MQDLLVIVEYPIKRLVDLLFSLTMGSGSNALNIGSVIVVGFLFTALIGVITHSTLHGNIGRIFHRIRGKKDD